jgi:type IV secretory pathway TraG/TraD family ATPase VirD4
LGTILMMEIFAAGLHRSQLPEKERRPANIYVDEFQNFVSDNVASMLSEARKFGLRLTLANQTLTQLRASAGRQDLLETVLGNVGNVILFRLGVPDADRLQLFTEPYTRQQMQELPNFHALARLLTAEGPVRPLIMKTLKY